MRITDIIKAIASAPCQKLNGGKVSNDIMSRDGSSSYLHETPYRVVVTLTPEVYRAICDKAAEFGD